MASKADMSWEDAIQAVLQDASGTMRPSEIADKVFLQGYRANVGASPATTVAAILSTSLKKKGSPFTKFGRGEFALKESARPLSKTSTAPVTDEQSESGAIRALGMFWSRDLVTWSGTPLILGRQGAGGEPVNFADQVGVYLLYDRDRVIYVGRAADTLFARLQIHTMDRLGGRWDRFSWFGLKAVKENGTLSDAALPWTHDVVIDTMEALLIESLEPPQNRKRGDNFSGTEFIQVVDPEIERRRAKILLDKMAQSYGLG
jgi:hypothetical protein